MNQIDVKIHKDGRVDINLRNFESYSCLDATRTIEHLLGNDILNRQFSVGQLSETITPTEKIEKNR